MLDNGAVEQVPTWARAAEARASRPPPRVPENVGMKDGTEPTPVERIHKSRLEAGGGGGGRAKRCEHRRSRPRRPGGKYT